MSHSFQDGFAACITAWVVFSLCAYSAAVVWVVAHVDWRAVFDSSLLRKRALHTFDWWWAAVVPRQQHDISPVDAAAGRLFQERKRDFVRRGLYAVSPIIAIGNFFTICRALGAFHVEVREDHLSQSHLIVTQLAPALAALCALRQDRLSKPVVVLAQVIGYGGLIWTLYSFKTGLDMLFDRSTALVIRLAMTMMLCDIRLTVVANSLYFVLVLLRFRHYATGEEDIAKLGFVWYVYQELVACVVLVVVHVVLEWRMKTEARTTIEAKESTDLISGLSQLLTSSYDVVVELNHDLAFADDAKDLSVLLLHGQHRSLKGSRITDLLAEDNDKEAFVTHVMQQPQAAQTQCSAIPHIFRMTDTCSNQLSMELWHTRFQDLDSRSKHLIGIKEQMSDDRTPTRQPRRPVFNPTAASVFSKPKERRPEAKPDVSDDEQPRQGHLTQQSQKHQGSVGEHRGPVGEAPGRIPKPTPDGQDSDASSVASNRSARSIKHVVEGMARTSATAQRTSVLQLLSAWNVPVRHAACCSYHELIREASYTVKCLGRHQCVPVHLLFGQEEKFQCPSCGIMSVSAEAAGYDVRDKACSLCRVVATPGATDFAEVPPPPSIAL